VALASTINSRPILFLAALCEAQHNAQDGAPAPELRPPTHRARARVQHAALDRNRFTASAEFDATFGRLLGSPEAIEKPAAAARRLRAWLAPMRRSATP